MSVPIVFPGQCFIYAIIEVFIVRENDMTADVVELGMCQQRYSNDI